MSTEHSDRKAVADATMAFVKAFDGWARRASVAKAGESVPRLQLLYELHCRGPRKMADLAEVLGVTPRAVTTLVDALEADDLVRRTAHPTDRRVTMIEITEGATGVEDQFSAFQTVVEDLFADLDDAEADALQHAFDVLRKKIDRVPQVSATSE